MITAFIGAPGNWVNKFNCQHWHFFPPASTPLNSFPAPLGLGSTTTRRTKRKRNINKNMHPLGQVTSQSTSEWLQNVTEPTRLFMTAGSAMTHIYYPFPFKLIYRTVHTTEQYSEYIAYCHKDFQGNIYGCIGEYGHRFLDFSANNSYTAL